MTSREFLRWVWYLNKKAKEDFERTEKVEWYLAQIAYEVVTKDLPKREAKKVSLKDFMLFGPEANKRRKRKMSGREMFEAMSAAFRRMAGPADGKGG